MNMTSIGDLAQSLMLRHRSVELKQTISNLSQELGTGQVGDVSSRLGGDFSYLSDIERNLARLDGYSVAASEAAFFTNASQLGLERLQDLSASLSNALLANTPSGLHPVSRNIGTQAMSDLESAISALNGSAGGRSLFAGTATDRQPLASADVMMSELKTLVAGLGSAAAVEAAVKDWFADPAGFKAVMYAGSDDTLAPIQIGSGQEVALSLKADDPAFRAMMSNMAIAALAGDPAVGLDKATQTELFRSAGAGLLGSQDQLTGIRADLGFAEARIEEAGIRNATARTGLEYARNTLLQADPFETATKLEEAQFQLETLYTVTVRSSQLSLLNFMR
ncbi:flagellin [Sedimentitalea sp. JM2-8]|uniref:Flagellin n=1 Tax=Sedimentitalea xiamensis TaxID=3050037 RepID=A0ABT7F8W2_9RHOB|nr:flagellin [Sedimentitalea xiamensis]MDK3071545.1 flagellin [Sedimentitalea xiamensis]